MQEIDLLQHWCQWTSIVAMRNKFQSGHGSLQVCQWPSSSSMAEPITGSPLTMRWHTCSALIPPGHKHSPSKTFCAGTSSAPSVQPRFLKLLLIEQLSDAVAVAKVIELRSTPGIPSFKTPFHRSWAWNSVAQVHPHTVGAGRPPQPQGCVALQLLLQQINRWFYNNKGIQGVLNKETWEKWF